MRIVDTHAHFIPDDVIELVRLGQGPDGTSIEARDGVPWMVHRQGYTYPLYPQFYDVEARLERMAATGITDAVLSVPPTLFLYWTPAAEAAATARLLNDALARAAGSSDGRLSAIATLPMQDPDAAIAELQRAVLELDMKGAEIGPHIESVPLDDPDMSRVLSVAAELDVPLVIHPYYVGNDPVLSDFYLTNLLGNPWQTTVCATRLIVSGTLDRLRGLRMLLVHGGGYLATALGRLDHGYRVRRELEQMTAKPSQFARRFYYDSLTHDPVGLHRLIETVGPDRVLFGTDMPFDMGEPSFTQQVGGDPPGQDILESVAHKNAEALFGLQEVPTRA